MYLVKSGVLSSAARPDWHSEAISLADSGNVVGSLSAGATGATGATRTPPVHVHVHR